MARFLITAVIACLASSVVSLVQQEQLAQQEQIAPPDDMACTNGPRATQWLSIKKRFRALLEAGSGRPGPFKPVSLDALATAVKDSIAELEPVRGLSADADAVSECGFGKLFIQLLSIATVEEPAGLAQYFQEHPAVSNPVLTMLLDIPWITMAQSGWPFMGILAQINYQKVSVVGPMLNSAAVDGIGDETAKVYFDVMVAAREIDDLRTMATVSQMYLRSPPDGSPFATLTALSTQCAISMDVQDRVKGMQLLQDSLRQALPTAPELDIGLSVRWPLWGFLHMAVDVFADVF